MKPVVLTRGSIPVLCLHGFLGEPEDWRPLAEALGPPFGVRALRLPGHDAPRAASFAEAVERIAESLRGAHVIGYSMGGRLALAAALRGISILSLAIISSSPGLESGLDRANRARDDDRLADDLERRGLELFVRDWYRQPLFASLRQRPGLLRALQTRRARGDAADRAAALRALSVGRQPPLWTALSRLRTPTLFIAGDQDPNYAALLARAAGLCPAGRLLTVPGAGHLPHLECPNFVGYNLRAHLEDSARWHR